MNYLQKSIHMQVDAQVRKQIWRMVKDHVYYQIREQVGDRVET